MDESAAFPGELSGVAAADKTWDLTALDPATQTFQSTAVKQGDVDGLKVDAAAGKFGPRNDDAKNQHDTQVNVGTVIWVPVAQSEGGATLTVSGTPNKVTFTVDDQGYKLGDRVELDTSAEARYVKVEASGEGSAYLTSISIDYVADTSTYPGTPQNVTATDKTWDFTSDEAAQRPAAESGQRAEFDGIRVDATVGRFSPRSGENQDTQVNAGTVLYVPVAADPKGATLRVEGNNYNNLTITVDGEEQKVGTDITLDATDTAYVAVAFSSEDGNGSCYLSSISVDYGSDTTQDYHVVTVGASGDYQSIQDALDHETSSLKDHLVLSIAPGNYYERVVVSQPGVIFQNADETGENAVVIRASYYSSNVRDDKGEYVKQDEFDLGTDKCATVLIESTGTGFSASNITFQNDYNIVGHTGGGEQTPAVAFNSKADKVELQNCSFIGRQDTLYVQGAGNRVFLTDCYVEGTVDFVFGDAGAYFEGCQLHMAAFPGRTSGYYTAANTKAGYAGLVFSNCTLTADSSLTDVSLGRPWQNICKYGELIYDSERHSYYVDIDTSSPNADYENISSSVNFIGCTMPSNLKSAHWNLWTGRSATKNDNGGYDYGDTTSITYTPTVRFAEYGSKNADGSLMSASQTDFSKLNELGLKPVFDANADTAQVLAGLLAQMGIGSDGWDPADLTFQSDGDFWTPAVPLIPGQSTNPPAGGNIGLGGNTGTDVNTNTNQANANVDATSQNTLPAAGDATSYVLPVVLVVVAVAVIAGALYLRKRHS